MKLNRNWIRLVSLSLPLSLSPFAPLPPPSPPPSLPPPPPPPPPPSLSCSLSLTSPASFFLQKAKLIFILTIQGSTQHTCVKDNQGWFLKIDPFISWDLAEIFHANCTHKRHDIVYYCANYCNNKEIPL